MRIGVDLGGTKIEIAAFGENGQELTRRRVATPDGPYENAVEAIAGLVEAVEAETSQEGTVGVGTPGAISPATGLIKNANSTRLNGHPLDRDLSKRLGREVRTANDANCFALSEAIDGAGAGARVVFGAILGTGVGGGIVVDGRVLVGPNAIAGEWGHSGMPWPAPAEWPGPECYCGRRGCIESLLSGPAFERDFVEATGRLFGAADIVASAEGQNPEAIDMVRRYGERLARALASVINLLDPDVIVLGGGMSNTRWLYENVPKLWGPFVFSDRVDTRLSPPVHGDSSGVRGAAWLWD